MHVPKVLGHLLLWIGFLSGAFLTVRNLEVKEHKWRTIHWPLYGIALGVGVAGVTLLRHARSRDAAQSDKVEANVRILEVSLHQLLERLELLRNQADSFDVFEVHSWIDAQLMPAVGDFVQSREALIHTYGLPAYAEMMTDFSIGERSVHRAWSASADGYVDEVWLCLDRAAEKWRSVSAQLARQRAASITDPITRDDAVKL
jgi:hypothetical protein